MHKVRDLSQGAGRFAFESLGLSLAAAQGVRRNEEVPYNAKTRHGGVAAEQAKEQVPMLRFRVFRSQFSVCVLCLAAGLLGGAAAWAADPPAFDAERFIADKAPALVTLKFNLRRGQRE